MKDEINRVRRRYLGRYGYIEYWKAVQFAAEVLGYLDREVHILIKQGKLEEAFDLSNFILEKMCSTPMDDDGEMMDAMGSVSLVWHEIYDKADDGMRKKMFDWMIEQMLKTKYELLAQTAEDFAMAMFDDRDELRRKLGLCEEMVKEYKNGQIEYGGIRWVLYKVRIMEQLGVSSEEVRKFYEEWSGEIEMRISMTDWSVERGEYEEAREILERIAEDSDDHYYVGRCRAKLDVVYAKVGDIEARRKNLRKMLSESVRDDRDLYGSLRKLYDRREWSGVRGEVIAGMSRHFDRAYYYAKEKMDDELLGLLHKERSLEQIKRYAGKLSNGCTDDVVGLYKELLKDEMPGCMGRFDYQKMVEHLKALCRIEGGREIAMELVKKWRGEHKNRRALLDELEKFEGSLTMLPER